MNSFITGYVVALVTFPGVMVRQLVKQLLCWYLGIPVFKVSYFSFWPAGECVVYEPPGSPWTGMILLGGVAVANTVLGLTIGGSAVFALLTYDDVPWISVPDLLFVWLGVSIAVHSIPTFKDADAFLKLVSADHNETWVQIVGMPFAALMYGAAIGSFLWLDVIYGVIVVIVLPILVYEVLR